MEKYQSRVNELYFELPNFAYNHGSTKVDEVERDIKFIGRETITNKITELITDTNSSTGAYLVTGFRGMGKTSIVNHALDRAKKRKADGYAYQIIELSLAQDNLSDYEILKQLTYKVAKAFKSDIITSNLVVVWRFILNILLFAVAGYIVHRLGSTIGSGFLSPGSEQKTRSFISIFLQGEQGIQFNFWSLCKLLLKDTMVQCFVWLLASFLIFWVLRFIYGKIRDYIYGLVGNLPDYEKQKRLMRLIARIESKVIENQNQLNGNWENLNPFKRKQREFQLATAKDIEAELISIFGTPGSKGKKLFGLTSPNKFTRFARTLIGQRARKFVFVFDEMDKIDAQESYKLLEKQMENPYEQEYGSEGLIKRQEAVYKLLGNLKHFLNTAEAKFIFIAGREMFDASLADVSDRDSFLGSIFHDVLYVKSFWKEKLYSDSLSITSMTEAFVCKMLLPEYNFQGKLKYQHRFWQEIFEGDTEMEQLSGQKKKDYDSAFKLKKKFYKKMHLKTYRKYLDYLITDYNRDCAEYDKHKNGSPYRQLYTKCILDLQQSYKANLPNWYFDVYEQEGLERAREEAERVKEKAILSLYRLIIYLTHRSNGTPKKLTKLFEDFIASSFSHSHVFDFADRSKQSSRHKVFYLRIKYNDQYRFGLIHSIIRPYLLSNGRHLKPLGDKQLVSTSFLVDYIFKFHPIAFTYRNFELTPELIAFNKSPDLRNYIEHLILFLSSIHIREVQNGLFQFKFNKRTSQELSFLSKISEIESAALNFSLDESLLVKRHYNRKLKQLHKQYANAPVRVETNEFLYSIGFVNEILGDLHYYDQEFDDAMVHYSNTVQQLRKVEEFCTLNQERTTNLLPLLLLLRLRLKICLTLEKMKSFSTAYATTLELCESVLIFGSNYHQKNILGSPTAASLPEVVEATRIMIQPFIIKLFLSEKGTFGPLTLREVLNSCKSVEELVRKAAPNFSSYQLLGNFYREIGTLLYYKNCLLFDDVQDDRHLSLQYTRYQSRLNQMPDSIKRIDMQDSGKRRPVSALVYYQLALDEIGHLAKVVLNRGQSAPNNLYESYCFIINLLRNNSGIGSRPRNASSSYIDYSKANMQLFSLAADILAKLGDTILPFDTNSSDIIELCRAMHKLKKTKIWYEFNGIETNHAPLHNDILSLFDPSGSQYYQKQSVILHYYIAGLLYKKAGSLNSYTAQLRKIMYVVHGCYDYSNIPFAGCLNRSFSIIEEDILNDFLKSTSRAGEITDRIQILKYRNIFGTHNHTYLGRPPQFRSTGTCSASRYSQPISYTAADWLNEEKTISSIYNGLASTPDLQEMLCIFYELLLSTKMFTFSLNNTVVSATSIIDSRFVRIHQLRLKVKLNYHYLKVLGYWDRLNLMIARFSAARNQGVLKEAEFWENDSNWFFQGVYNRRTLNYDENIPTNIARQIFGHTNRQINHEEMLEFLIADSIFCLHECIKTIQIFGHSHTMNYSVLANCQKKMGDWCKYYEMVNNEYQYDRAGNRINNKLKIKLIDLIGDSYISYLDSRYHYEIAMQNYHKVMHVHSEGSEYYSFINSMFYLEDDFNDSLDHFSAAMERRHIACGNIRANLEALKQGNIYSRLFQVNRYSRDIGEQRNYIFNNT